MRIGSRTGASFTGRERYDAWAEPTAPGSPQKARGPRARARMNRANPHYVLRNWLAHEAIRKAKERDYSEIDRLLTLSPARSTSSPAWRTTRRPRRNGRPASR